MKRFCFFIALFLALMCIVPTVFAAATSTVKNVSVTADESKAGGDWVLYSFTATTTDSDSVGINYTQAMYIGDYNMSENAYVYLVGSASGVDCNVSAQYSNDRTNWYACSINSGVIKDALSNTAYVDTLNVIATVEDPVFRMFNYLRLKLDYQAGTPSGATVKGFVRLKKPSDFTRKFAEAVNHLD